MASQIHRSDWIFPSIVANFVTGNISINVDTICSPILHGAVLEQNDTAMYPLPRWLIYLNVNLSLPWMWKVVLLLYIIVRSTIPAKNTKNKTRNESNKINQWSILMIKETSNKQSISTWIIYGKGKHFCIKYEKTKLQPKPWCRSFSFTRNLANSHVLQTMQPLTHNHSLFFSYTGLVSNNIRMLSWSLLTWSM